MRIFTKRFFMMPHHDQVAVVDATLADLQMALGQVVPQDRSRLKRQIRRIEAKAVEYGIYEASEKPVADGGDVSKSHPPRHYASVSWTASEIMTRFGIPKEEAEGFLCEYEEAIRELVIATAWDAIDLIGDGFGWLPRHLDENEAAIEKWMLGQDENDEEELPSTDDEG